jgi:two-component system response regulator LytT
MNIALCVYDSIDEISACLSILEKKDIKINTFEEINDLIVAIEKGSVFALVILEVVNKETIYKIEQYIKCTKLILLSNSYSYIQSAFKINAFQYFKKPVDREELLNEVKRALTIKKEQNIYEIKYKNNIYCIDVNELLYIETFDRHLIATTLSKKIKFIGKLCDEDKKLLQYGFIRCHKCYLLNMKHITSVYENYFILCDNTKIPISTRTKKDILMEYSRFLSNKLI